MVAAALVDAGFFGFFVCCDSFPKPHEIFINAGVDVEADVLPICVKHF